MHAGACYCYACLTYEGGNHHCHPLLDKRGQCVAERLAAASRHKHEDVTACSVSVNETLLPWLAHLCLR